MAGLVKAEACDGCWWELSVGSCCLGAECGWSWTHLRLVCTVGVVDEARSAVGW